MEEEPGIWLGEVASCVEVHVALALVSRRFSLVQVASEGEWHSAEGLRHPWLQREGLPRVPPGLLLPQSARKGGLEADLA